MPAPPATLIFPANFNSQGYLDPGFHAWNVETLRFHFVDMIPHSTTRPVIWSGFGELRICLGTLGLQVEQWVGGSFTSTKPDPNDLDVANFFDPDQIGDLSDQGTLLLRTYVSGKSTQHLCHCDSYFALKVPEEHPLREDFETAYNYWLEKFGTDRNDTQRGIVVTPCEPPTPIDDDPIAANP